MSFNIELFKVVNSKFNTFFRRYDLRDLRNINMLTELDLNNSIIIEKIYNIIKINYIEYNRYDFDIYIIIIFLYYSLVLFEPDDDYLYFEDLQKLSLNSDITMLYCMKIATSDDEYCSIIRRLFFNMDDSIEKNKSCDLCLLN